MDRAAVLLGLVEALFIAFFIGLGASGSWLVAAVAFVIGLPLMVWWNANS